MVEIYNKDQGIGYAPLPEISLYFKIEKSRHANPRVFEYNINQKPTPSLGNRSSSKIRNRLISDFKSGGV
jgi:hypothetical protein